MATITVPRWFIRERFLPDGQRLPKMPPKLAIVKREQVLHPEIITYPPSVRITSGYLPKTWREFDRTEYRYWAAAPIDEHRIEYGMIYECRACKMMVTGKTARRQHHDERGCTKKLVDAYRRLLPDRKCVICDLYTTKTKFGVPICGDGCLKIWCEEESQPAALTAALQLVR